MVENESNDPGLASTAPRGRIIPNLGYLEDMPIAYLPTPQSPADARRGFAGLDDCNIIHIAPRLRGSREDQSLYDRQHTVASRLVTLPVCCPGMSSRKEEEQGLGRGRQIKRKSGNNPRVTRFKRGEE